MTVWPQYAGIAAFAVAVAGYLVYTMVNANGRHDLGKWLISLTMLAGAVGFALRVPSVYTGVDRLAHVPNFSALLGALAYLAVATLLHVWIAVWPDKANKRHAAIALISATTVTLLLVVLFAVGQHQAERPSDFPSYYDHGANIAFTVVYLASFTASWPFAGLACSRALRDLEKDDPEGEWLWLRYGMKLVRNGMWLAFGYAVIESLQVFSAITSEFTSEHLLLSLGNVVALCSASNSASGAMCGLWGRWLADVRAPVRARKAEAAARRRYRLLNSLWESIASQVGTNPVPTGLAHHGAVIAAQYVVIQLADGFRDLAKRADARVARRAEARARRLGYGKRKRAAIVEVAVLKAAAHANAHDQTPADVYPLPLIDQTQHVQYLEAIALAAPLVDSTGEVIGPNCYFLRCLRRLGALVYYYPLRLTGRLDPADAAPTHTPAEHAVAVASRGGS